MSQEKRNNLIIEELHKHQKVKNKFVKTPSLWGVDLCWSCFSYIHGVSQATVYRLRDIEVQHAETRWEHKGKHEAFHEARKANAVKAFIQELQTNLGKYHLLSVLLTDRLGEHHPDSEKIELPPDTKENHFIDFQTTSSHVCVYDYFLKIWRHEFPTLYLPKNSRWVIQRFFDFIIFLFFLGKV
jgi:hypothetical protein